MRRHVYENLTAWQRVQIARHSRRAVRALVAQRVEAGGDDVGRGATLERSSARIGEARGRRGPRRGEVVVAKPVHLLAGEEEPLGEGRVGRPLARVVGHRVDQRLNAGPARRGRGQLRDHRRQVAARCRRRPRSGRRRRRGARPRRAPTNAASESIDRPGRDARSEPVVDREHQRGDWRGEEATRLIVGVEVADHMPPPW